MHTIIKCMASLNNLAITATNSAMISATGMLWNTLQSKLANGGRDSNCKFYYNNGAGGSVLQVVARNITGGAVSELKDFVQNQFNSLLNGNRTKTITQTEWVNAELEKQAEEKKQFGMMKVDGGVVYALDEWGGIATEALMLGIKLEEPITISQTYPVYDTIKVGSGNNTTYKERFATERNYIPNSKTLVWYDTTALISINSDKNLLSTRVQGRDYSRKELISNGDIKFSVSGQITSGRPDIYPAEEMKKFLKVMQYKGVIEVNNQVLSQFGIDHIVITDFSVTPKQGYKSLQQYTFNAIGLQPENEIEVKSDTVTILTQAMVDTSSENENGWMDMLKDQLQGLKSMAEDAFSQGLGLATGLLDKTL